MNAKRLVQQFAQMLTENGWTVEITSEPLTTGTDTYSFVATRDWHDAIITASAIRPLSTNRWNFVGVGINTITGGHRQYKTYSRAQTAIEIFGRAWAEVAS